MYLIPKQEMPAKLSKSWAFLSGAVIDFHESESVGSSQGKHCLSVVLPVVFENKPHSKSLAIGLMLDEHEARRVAAYMFGMAEDALTDDDIRDACKESCNVLGGSLVSGANNKLGIPEEISNESFYQLQANSQFHAKFVSGNAENDLISLIILDVYNQTIWS